MTWRRRSTLQPPSVRSADTLWRAPFAHDLRLGDTVSSPLTPTPTQQRLLPLTSGKAAFGTSCASWLFQVQIFSQWLLKVLSAWRSTQEAAQPHEC